MTSAPAMWPSGSTCQWCPAKPTGWWKEWQTHTARESFFLACGRCGGTRGALPMTPSDKAAYDARRLAGLDGIPLTPSGPPRVLRPRGWPPGRIEDISFLPQGPGTTPPATRQEAPAVAAPAVSPAEAAPLPQQAAVAVPLRPPLPPPVPAPAPVAFRPPPPPAAPAPADPKAQLRPPAAALKPQLRPPPPPAAVPRPQPRPPPPPAPPAAAASVPDAAAATVAPPRPPLPPATASSATGAAASEAWPLSHARLRVKKWQQTAIESSGLVLRIARVVSGVRFLNKTRFSARSRARVKTADARFRACFRARLMAA